MSYIDEFKKGLKLCLDNHDLWVNESKILYDKGNYGHAYALLIHGAEALIQAFFCWQVLIRAKKPNDKDVIQVFREHEPKLESLFGFILAEVNKQHYLEHKNEYEWNKSYTEEELEEEFEKIKKAAKKYSNEKRIMRNRGIYVDYDPKNLKFSSPSDIKQEEVEYLLGDMFIAQRIIKGLIFNTSPELRARAREALKHF